MRAGFNSAQANWTTPNASGIFERMVLIAGGAPGGAHCSVTAVHQQDAAERLTPFTPPATGPGPVGTFTVVGRGQTATFNGITLARYEPEITRRKRRQLVSCHYPVTPGTFRQLPINFVNTDSIKLAVGALQNDYTFGIDAFPEHLLGFGMAYTPAGSPVYWFSKLANRENQLRAKLTTMINAQAADANRQFANLDIRFAQGNLTVTPQNLVRAYSFFAYGEALQWPLPTMSELVGGGAGAVGVPNLGLVHPPALTDEQRIRYEYDPSYEPAVHTYGVETLALVLTPGSPVLPVC